MTATKHPLIFWSQHHITRVQRELTKYQGWKSALVKQPTEFTSELEKITEAIHALPELGAMVIHNTLSEWEDDPPDKKLICCRTLPTSTNNSFDFCLHKLIYMALESRQTMWLLQWVVANCLVPIWCHYICKHRDDVDQLVQKWLLRGTDQIKPSNIFNRFEWNKQN